MNRALAKAPESRAHRRITRSKELAKALCALASRGPARGVSVETRSDSRRKTRIRWGCDKDVNRGYR
jgi:hypothetical protein